MTVCIGAIADGGKSAILVADNMVTFTTAGLQYQSDHIRHKKIYEITSDIYILVAGDTTTGDLICQNVKKLVSIHLESKPDEKIYIENLVNALKQEYQNVRLQKIEDHLLKSRGITLEEYKLGKFNLVNNTIALIEDRLTNRNLGVELVIAGLNQSLTYSIYTMGNPGAEVCNDVIGFTSIGSGGPHAMYHILGSAYTKDLTNDKVKDIILSAKKSSEFAPGVGKNHDCQILGLKND